MYIYTCVYIYTHIYIYTHTHTHIYICIYTHVYIFVYIYVYKQDGARAKQHAAFVNDRSLLQKSPIKPPQLPGGSAAIFIYTNMNM